MAERIILSWSGGKDCTFALYELQQNPAWEITGLFTTMDKDSGKISMHGTDRELLKLQAASLSYKIDPVFLPPHPSNKVYRHLVQEQLSQYKSQGINCIAFADLFLEDIKEYRIRLVEETGMKAIFPLWKRNTLQLATDFIESGFKAIVTSVDTARLDPSFAGQEYDHSFLAALPDEIDPCGENGEFHTFVYNGPVFRKKVDFTKNGNYMEGNRFYICDIVDIKR